MKPMLTRFQVTLRAKIDHSLTQQARVLAMGLTASSFAVGLRAQADLSKTLFRVGEPGSEGPKDRERERPEEPFLAPRSRTELFFIDAAVADPRAFWLAAPRGATVICIPTEVDSWEFMAHEAARFRGLGAIHIISHGQPGALVLNGCRYTAADLSPKAALLYKLGQALTKNGDILLYGCDTGEGVEGARLVTELADFTGADVGASSNLTGGLPGDDWKLEVTHGVLKTLPIAPVGYNYELSTTTVSTVTALKSAITTGSTNGSDDTIILTANITFAAPSNAIVIHVTDGHTLTILGGGFTLSGNNLARVLDVSTSGAGSAVVIDNLTIAKGFSSGLGGNRALGAGLPGGDALGANIRNTGILSITHSTITAGKAAGGGGAGGDTYGAYRGGAGGGGGGFGATFGARGGSAASDFLPVAYAGSGGKGAGFTSYQGGYGGSTVGGSGGYDESGSYSIGGVGGTSNGSNSIGGGGGGAGYDAAGGRGGNAVGGIYNTGLLTIANSNINNNIGAGGGGGGGGKYNAGNNDGLGGSGTGAIWNAGGTIHIDAGTIATFGSTNAGGGGNGAIGSYGPNRAPSGTSTSGILTTGAGITDTVYATAVATTSGGTTAFTEGNNVTSTPVVVDSGLTVTDADYTTLARATVAITGNLHTAEDSLAFTNDLATMGNISGVYTSSTGVLALTSSGSTATVAQWQAALSSVVYTNSSNTPNTSNRTISFTVNDGLANSPTVTKTVSVASVDDTPVDTASGGNTAFTEGNNVTSTPVAVDSGITVTDLDNGTLASTTVAITGNFQSVEDLLAFTNNPATMGNISGSYNSGTGILTLNSSGATATTAQWQAALRSVVYTNSSNTPNTSNRTISFTTNDGTSNGNTTTKTVTVASVNDAPIVTSSGGSAAFIAGDNITSTPIVIDSGVTISDLDNSTLASATVSITGNFQSGEDVLSFTNNPATMGNIAGSYDSGTGVLTLTSSGATATLAQWQAALRSVTYTDNAVTPNTATRTFSFVANDGSSDSATTTRTVTVADTNQTPILATSGGTTAFTEGNNVTSTPIVIDSGLTVADADNSTLASAVVAITANFQSAEDSLSFTNNPATMGNISAVYNSGTGVLTLTSAGATATKAQWQAALRSITYTDSSDTPNTANRTISFTINDGTEGSLATTKIVSVASTDDAPVETASGGNTAWTEGNNVTSTPVVVDGGFTVTDLDNSTLGSATVAITGNLHTAEDSLAFTNNPATMGNISGSYSSGTGILTLTSSGATATLAQWQAALRSVTYTNSSNTPNTSDRTISFTTNDGAADGNTTTKTVTVASVNDSPITTSSGGSTAFVAGNNISSAPVVIDSGITVTDVDSTSLASATVAITGSFQSGEDVLLFTNTSSTLYGNISASYNAGTGVLTLTSSGATATLAQWQAALSVVTYFDSAITPNTATRTFSFVVNDGSSDSTTTTRNVTVADTDQTPIVTTTGGSIGYIGGAAAVTVDSSITVSDLDNSTQLSATASISSGFHTGDTLSFTNTSASLYGNISGSFNSGTGVLTLTSSGGTATNTQWANAFSALTFSAGVSVSPGNRTISFVVNDGTTNSAAATDTVAVSGGPTITTDAGSAAFSRSNNSSVSPVAIDTGLTISDSGSPTLSTATVAISVNFQSGEDALAFTNNPATMGDIVGSYNSSNGVLTLTSVAGATLAQWQAALDSITYIDNSRSPNLSTRTISFGATDSNSNVSNTATRQVTVADTAVPAVVSVTVPANGTYSTGQNLDFTVTYDEPVTVDTTGGTPYIVVTLGSGTAHAVYTSGSGTTTLVFRYTISAGNADPDGIVLGTSIVLNGATARDAANNSAGVFLNSVGATTGVLVDAVAPAVSSSNRQSPSGSTTNATSAIFRVTFSKSVTGVDAGDFALTPTGSATGTIGSVSGVSGSIYDVTVNSLGGNGTLRLDLESSGTGIVDTSSNAIASGFTAGQIYTLDHTAPTVSAIVRQSPTALSTSVSPVTFRVSFSEAVTGVDISAFALTTVNGSATGTILSVNAISASLYDVTVGSLGGLGLLRLDANAGGSVVDSAGNAPSTAFNTGDVYEVGTIDVFNFTSLAQTSSRSVSAQLGFRAAQRFTTGASAPLTLFDVAAQILTASGAQPVVTINNDASGVIGSVVSTLTNPTTLVSNSLNVWSGNIPLAPNTTYWVVFDDTSAAGLYAVSYTNATAGGAGAWATTSDYQFDVYASGNWTTQAGGLRVDLGALAAASISAPTPPADGSYHAGQNIDFTVNFSAPVTVTGLPTLGLTIGSTAQIATYVSGSGTNALLFRYIVQVGDADADGIVLDSTVALNGGTIRDANSIDAPLTFTPPVTTGIVIGTPAPTITSSATANGAYDSSFSYSIAANSVVPIIHYSATGLPTGLALDSTSGAITGTPMQSGDFTISLGATNATGTGLSTLTLTVAKANATIALGSLAQTYGATSAVTATTSPSALPVGIIYNGSATVPTDAGSYSIAATITDPNYQGSAAGTLVISLADQTLAFDPGASLPLNQSITLTATASSGLPVVYTLVSGPATLSGSVLTATGSGAIDVRASQAGNSNYNPVTLDRTLSSAKTSQTIAFAAPGDHLDNDTPFALNAVASSGLSVLYTVDSGPATLSGNTLSLTGDDGTVSITASQPGDALYSPATSVTRLFVVSAAYKSRLLNLSSRGHVGTGQNILIAGFIITGTESKRVVLRGVGPGLTDFGVQGVLAKPIIRLYDGGRNLLMSNSGWADDPAISAAFAEIGAVPFATGSADSALVATLPPGGYTLQVLGQNDTTGVALAEVYDASTTASATHQRLFNFSSRGVVGTGENVLIGGFIITGTAPKSVLVRAIGPSLTKYGLTSVLADPVLTLHDANGVITSNDNWETLDNPANGDVAATTTKVGAIPLDAGSKDAALALTLAPGGYTAIVAGSSATTGVVLLEIYEVPQ